jgi:hypothetical protein
VIVARVRKLGAHAFQLDGLPELFGELVWCPHIPERTVLKDASDAAQPLQAFADQPARELVGLYDQLADRLEKELA